MSDIREKAEALIYILENKVGRSSELIKATEDLKAALRPSRDEIAERLANFFPLGEMAIEYRIDAASMRRYKETLKLAIEELRK